jgi:hypothetical protein
MLSERVEFFTRRLTDAKKTTEIKNQNTVAAALEFYDGNMKELFKANKPLLDDLELRAKHNSQTKSAHHKLKRELVKCDTEKQAEYITKLDKVYSKFICLIVYTISFKWVRQSRGPLPASRTNFCIPGSLNVSINYMVMPLSP